MSGNDKDFAPLTAICVRNLNDKLYEKRKMGALEVERMVRDFSVTGQTVQIQRVLKVLGEDLALSHNPNSRKGGVIGLAATAIALGKESTNYVAELVKPVLDSFTDQDSRVRYYACEALYNISKVCRGFVLPYFNEIFDGLSKLSSDTDQNVKNGTELLDRLIKDIVTESSAFDLRAFIPILREKLYVKQQYPRQFIVSWIAVLDAVPDINMLVLLPEILHGLFEILGDPNPEISKMCQNVLQEFLNGIKKTQSGVNYEGMANILITHSLSDHPLIQYTAICWLQEFVAQAERTMLQYTSGIIHAVLPCLATEGHITRSVSEAAKHLNLALLNLICEEDDLPTPVLGSPVNPDPTQGSQVNPDPTLGSPVKPDSQNPDTQATNHEDSPVITKSSAIRLNVANVISVLCRMLEHQSLRTRIAALEWLSHLLLKVPNKTFQHVDRFFPVLLTTLSDTSTEVVLLDLETLAEISSNPAGYLVHQEQPGQNPGSKGKSKEGQTTPSSKSANKVKTKEEETSEFRSGLNMYFTKFMKALLDLFKKDQNLLEPEERGYFIIRQLSQLLNAVDVFQSLSQILVEEEDVNFACKMVQSLNTILLTSTELFDMRNQLKSLSTQESCVLFCCLYKSWCHSPVATVSLCYLSQNYRHACDLLLSFGNLEVTVDFLKEIDKLVQLIESPIFAYLRLQLLDVHNNQDLIKSLYGLLMLLPQSEAFKLLRYRLDCIPHYQLATIYDKHKGKSLQEQRPLVSKINFTDLLKHFQKVQEKHREARHKMAFRGRAMHTK
ncbi:protein VAC14 homolog [Pecten maximus]|uniref:protein VAC14 homolog n=1 Tax=Pecten maximus TaxID=6579 RepID=UPI001458F9D2|nr:protein VAC14 homolog [Pecten maximus]